jgi:ABC-type branched-subunit amino acid transport system ATPase component
VTDEAIIKVENVSLAFGGVQALYNIDTRLFEGEIFAIIGPNGAGIVSADSTLPRKVRSCTRARIFCACTPTP